MAETLQRQGEISKEEFDKKFEQEFKSTETRDWDSEIWDALLQDQQEDEAEITVASTPAVHEYTEAIPSLEKPIVFPDSDELLIEEGDPEPRLEAHNEIHSFDDPALEHINAEPETIEDEAGIIERGFAKSTTIPVTFESSEEIPKPLIHRETYRAPVSGSERTTPKHAAEYHEEEAPEQPVNVEAKEVITMDDRFLNLLKVADEIIKRRIEAVKSGDKSASLDDFESFLHLYTQYESEGLEKESLQRISNLVTATFNFIDKVPQGASSEFDSIGTDATVNVPASEELVSSSVENEGAPENQIIEGAFHKGQTVKAYVFTDHGAQFEDDWRVTECYADERTRKVALYQLEAPDGRILHNITEHEMILWRDAELKPSGETGSYPHTEGMPQTNSSSEASVDYSDEDTDGIDDITFTRNGPELVSALKTSRQHVGSEVSILPEESSPIENFKKWWGRNRKSAKTPYGNEHWAERWDKKVDNPYADLNAPDMRSALGARKRKHERELELVMAQDRKNHTETRRRFGMLGAAAGLAMVAAIGAGVTSNHVGAEHGPAPGAPAATETATPHATAETVVHPLNAKGFSIKSGEGGIEMFENLGLASTQWVKLGPDLATRFPNEFYLDGGNTVQSLRSQGLSEEAIASRVRVNHQGVMAQPVQKYISDHRND